MYQKDKSLSLKGSTSALCNNLSVQLCRENDTVNYAVVHKSVVNILSVAKDGSGSSHRPIICKEPSASHSNTVVLQSRLLNIAGQLLLVITSQKGIQIFETEGSLMLYWYSLGDLQHGEVSACFGRGICGLMDNTICVGNHDGEILVFDVPARRTNITVAETLRGHHVPVCALEADGDRMLSGDDMGNLVLWQAGENFQPLINIQGDGWPSSSLCLWKDVIVAGYGTGHLRIYSTASSNLTAEVSAHARQITAIDVSEKGLLISGSEDTFVRGWQLIAGVVPKISHVFNECVTDIQIQGVKFTTPEANSFAVSGYDSNELYTYKTG